MSRYASDARAHHDHLGVSLLTQNRMPRFGDKVHTMSSAKSRADEVCCCTCCVTREGSP
jgi:hypothetical protein